ncbi:membrane protein [Bacteroidia bacterium]|nr:membrane protein [Bacteroidia bacterium]
MKRIVYIIIAGILFLSSCGDSFLDETPSTSVDAATSIKTTNDIIDALNGLYSAAKSSSLFGRDVHVLGDLLADNAYISASNYGRFLTEQAYRFSQNSGSASGIWSQGYNVILQANRIIYTELTVPASQQVVVDRAKGEAYAWRALTNLVLVNFFGAPYTVNPDAPGIPVVTIPTYVTGPYVKPERQTVKEVYAHIFSDLEAAFGLISPTPIPSTYHDASSNYISKYAVKAIEARAALYKGDYAAARDAALEVVNHGGFTLAATKSAFTSYWTAATPSTNKLETILELNMSITSNLGSNGLDHMYNQEGYGDLLSAAEIYTLYSETDFRKSLVLDGIRKGNNQRAFVNNKYSNTANGDRDEVKILRYAEVILTLAEGYAKTNDETNALKYLNQLAQLRDPGFAGYTSSGQQLIDDIVNERRKELVFEGLRLFDLTRLNREIVRPAQQFSYPGYPLVSLTDHRRIQAIPQGEIDANPNIKQNPGYDD